ncbi:MAG: hypothetical protein ACE5FS_10050 [Paracoccaceae bacterium]
MIRHQLAGAAAATLLAAQLAASQAGAGSEGTPIAPGTWREMTAGKTVYYTIDGVYFGREYYVSGTDRIYFELDDGTCYSGYWRYEAPWYSFTFSYDGYVLGPDRFQHRISGDKIFITSDDPEQPSQQVDRVIAAPFTCETQVIG